MMDNIDYLVSLIAILKSGESFVSLSIDWPLERLQLIINELDPSVILTDESGHSLLTHLDRKFKWID